MSIVSLTNPIVIMSAKIREMEKASPALRPCVSGCE